jgi:predicted ATPase/DNA-binding CsgD family transcriptional regulator
MTRGGRRTASVPGGQAVGLPPQPTGFVGREYDMAYLAGLLAEARLVTISGAAGLGKTRLAVEVAARAGAGEGVEVRFAALAPLHDGALVAQAIASALGVVERAAEPLLQTLAGHIAGRRHLLVLDNCEHLVDAAAAVTAALLRDCPDLRVLATSREPLRVTGETVWRIAPLEVPDAAESDPRAIAGSEAARLFQASARRVRRRFTVGRGNAAAVGLLCRRLDGIPLAIELAAAHVETLSLDEVLGRLQDRFRLLKSSGEAGLPRHQTLRAALDWGHQLLDDRERVLFRRLSVFRGGFETSAAESVCAGDGLAAQDVLELVLRLADKSLLAPRASDAGPTRYEFLETVREYAAARLAESGERTRVEGAHAAHFLAMAERAERHDRGPEHVVWLSRLEADHDNLRAALDGLAAADPERCLRLAGLLAWFWMTRGYHTEGRRRLEAALAVAGEDASGRAAGLFGLARLAFWQGDYASARALCERSAELYAGQGDAGGRGLALSLLGSVHGYEADYAAGRARFEEVLATVDDQWIRLEAMVGLGELLVQAGDLAGARTWLERTRALSSGPEAPRGRAALFLGLVSLFEGDHTEGRSLLVESLDLFRELGNHYGAAASLDGLAGLAVLDGDPVRALRLSGAADALRDATGTRLGPRWEEVVRTAVLEPAFAAAGEGGPAAWAEGRGMGLAEAAEAATAGQAPVRAAAPVAASPRMAGPDGLSAREVEVAQLVGRGLTNRQIAERLGIAERTAEGHVERLRRKLRVRSRRDVAVALVRRRGWR